MTRALLAAATLSVLALGCTVDPPLTAPAFGVRKQKIWAEPSTVKLNEPFTIVTRCVPLVDGNGYVILTGRNPVDGTHWRMLEPVDTVMVMPSNRSNFTPDIYFPLVFHANQPLEIRWRVELSSPEWHLFEAYFQMDSIIWDKGPGMISIHSEEAAIHSGMLEGYQYSDFAEPDLEVHP